MTWIEDPYDAASVADLVVILSEWVLFREMDLAKLAGRMAKPRIADLRSVHAPDVLRAAGFTVVAGLGR